MVVTHSRLTLDRSRAHHRSLLAFCSSDDSFRACPLPPLQLSRKRQSSFGPAAPLAVYIVMVRSIAGACERTGLGLVHDRCHDRNHDGCWLGQPTHRVARDELWTDLARASGACCGSSYPDEATFQ